MGVAEIAAQRERGSESIRGVSQGLSQDKRKESCADV